MKIDVREREDVIIVDMEGRLVAGGSEQVLRDVINELIAEGWKKILLNLSEVAWIDSAGIGELVAGIKMAKRFGSSIKLLRVGDKVQHVLSISQILPMLDVFENEDEAISSFQVQPDSVGFE
jgi:anti-sigma B factor antagonist